MKPLIFIVDDDPLVCDLVKMYLEGASYNVMTATDGLEALEGLKRQRPALIILDIGMKRMSGLQMLHLLRTRQPWHADTPVMMLTASRETKSVKDAMATGASAYMVKPFTREQLLARVKKYAKLHEQSWMSEWPARKTS